jgi:hypothetical protein
MGILVAAHNKLLPFLTLYQLDPNKPKENALGGKTLSFDFPPFDRGEKGREI